MLEFPAVSNNLKKKTNKQYKKAALEHGDFQTLCKQFNTT
jgi:hypothetical protein